MQTDGQSNTVCKISTRIYKYSITTETVNCGKRVCILYLPNKHGDRAKEMQLTLYMNNAHKRQYHSYSLTRLWFYITLKRGQITWYYHKAQCWKRWKTMLLCHNASLYILFWFLRRDAKQCCFITTLTEKIDAKECSNITTFHYNNCLILYENKKYNEALSYDSIF